MLIPRLVGLLSSTKENPDSVNDYRLDGVSEKVFNMVYFNDLEVDEVVPFNGNYQVNHFEKTKAKHLWSISGKVQDAVIIHFSDDCYNVGKGLTTVPELQPMSVFERLHQHDLEAVGMLRTMAYGTSKLYGRRPKNSNTASCTHLIRSTLTVPSGLKGHTHCTQRAFAATLHLQFDLPAEHLNSLFKLKVMQDLGADTDTTAFNRCLRAAPVIDWLSVHIPRSIPQLLKPVVGDAPVRELLRNLERNQSVFTYPVDFRGVGRHCSLAYKSSDSDEVVIWDPSPSFDMTNELPLWVTFNETCLHVQTYEKACLLQWSHLPKLQTSANERRARKRNYAPDLPRAPDLGITKELTVIDNSEGQCGRKRKRRSKSRKGRQKIVS
jgi:hypothetical protein